MTQDIGPHSNRPISPGSATHDRRAGCPVSIVGAAAPTALRPSHLRILEAFRTYGPMVPDELAAHIGRSALYVRPRCSELRAMGLLRATGESRRNATSGLSAVVLAIVTSP